MDEIDNKVFIDVPFEPDLLPEFCEYHDTGCELAPACLSCPFPDCIHDTRNAPKSIRLVRSAAIAREYAQGNCDLTELAALYRVSVRTVKRAIHSIRKDRYSKRLAVKTVKKYCRGLPCASTESNSTQDYEEENIDCEF